MLGNGKFSYVTNMGLLTNCAFNLLLLIGCLVIFGLIGLLYQILRRMGHYNRIETMSNDQ